MEKLLLYIVAFFFILGAIDYLEGNRFKLGTVFEDGIKNMGPLAISMMGILSITPIISNILDKSLTPLCEKFGIDPSIFISSLIAVDMGAYNISLDIASSIELAIFSGILMASIIGCTLSFTLPLALGLVKEENMAALTKGILCGLVTTPIGLFVGGILLKINIVVLILNILHILLLAITLSLGIIYKPRLCLHIFRAIGKVIVFISILGFIIQGIYSITGIEIMSDIMPLSQALFIVGKIAIFLGGAYVMMECIQRVLNKQLNFIGNKIGVSSNSVTAFIGSLASAIIVFSNYDKLDYNGKVICAAFSVSGAYVLGGQLGFVASVEPDIIWIYILTKMLSGILAVIFAMYLLKREKKNKNKFNNLISDEE